MRFYIGFIISTAMALCNLPFIIDGSGGLFSVASMIFCGATALFHLVMAALTINN